MLGTTASMLSLKPQLLASGAVVGCPLWLVERGGEQDMHLPSWFGGEAQKLVCHADLEAKK